eukprot:m.227293 g.227293  ORF g.227293 m.227293 type:complete len:133 (+) comp54241_c0_seq2:1118-1516(+)
MAISWGWCSCPTCFDEIKFDAARGYSGRANRNQHGELAHAECFRKDSGPFCQECCLSLYAQSDRGLTGQWGIFKEKRYHLECYQRFAGPRCSSCFDVIYMNAEKGFSGFWRVSGKDGFVASLSLMPLSSFRE